MEESLNQHHFILPALILGFLFLRSFNPVCAQEGATSVAAKDRPDVRHNADTLRQFNEFGSYGLFINGIHAGLHGGSAGLQTTYSYRNFNGYREHSNDYSHNFDLGYQTSPSENTSLQILGHYTGGVLKRPGSLTKTEFEQDPFLADPRAVNRDEKRITQKGDVEIRFEDHFGESQEQRIEISGTGQIEYFVRSAKEYKITTRYIVGLTARYVNEEKLWNHGSEFTLGGTLLHQPERKEEYENFGGQQSDQLEQIEVEKTSMASCYFSENYNRIGKKLNILLGGKYDHVIYSVAEETQPARSDTNRFRAFTPDISLKYKIIPAVTIQATWEMKFRNPTDRELESPDPAYLYNQDLKSQTTNTLKASLKGDLVKNRRSLFLKSWVADATISVSQIENEIVRYEILGDEYFRNAGITNRFRLNFHTRLEIISNLNLSAGYSFSHYVYQSYITQSWEEDVTGNIVKLNRDFSGSTEPNIPVNSLNLALAYQHQVWETCSISAKISYARLGGLWVDDANSEKTAASNLMNVFAGFNMKFGRFICNISGGVSNLFNQVYVVTANMNSADRRFYNAGSPRDFNGSVNFGYTF